MTEQAKKHFVHTQNKNKSKLTSSILWPIATTRFGCTSYISAQKTNRSSSTSNINKRYQQKLLSKMGKGASEKNKALLISPKK